MKSKNNEWIQYAGIGLVVFLVFGNIQTDDKVITIAGKWNISEEINLKGYSEYLIEEHDFDYSYPPIWEKAKEIKSISSDPDDAVMKTAQFVADHVRYSSAITVQYCYDEKASDVMDTGLGDCVSMSRLVTSLLRAQGIPARTMGGCLSATKRCTPIFSTIPYLEAQTTEMIEGDFKKRGFLHEYVEVWTPTKEWQIIESTSGQMYDFSCNTYYDYGYDNDRYSRCVITQSSFWSSCKSY